MRWTLSLLLSLALFLALGAPPASAEVERQQEFYDLMRLLQAESRSQDQAYILDLSGSMRESLPVARQMMTSFVRDLSREGDRLVVVVVGADARTVIDAEVTPASRPQLLRQLEDPNLGTFEPTFSQFTDLDAGTYRTLRRLDELNEKRVRDGGLPYRQLVFTFSDFKKEPPPGSAFASEASAPARTLQHLKERLALRRVKEAADIDPKFATKFKGVPLRIEQHDFSVPAHVSARPSDGSFAAYLRALIAGTFETRDRKPVVSPLDAEIERLRAEAGKYLTLSNPSDFTRAPDGRGVFGVIQVSSKFANTTLKGLSLAAVAPHSLKTVAVELPDQTIDLAPGQSAGFQVRFPGLEPPPWYSTGTAEYPDNRLGLQALGTAVVGEVKPTEVALANVIPPTSLAFAITIPANPALLYLLIGFILLVIAVAAFVSVRRMMGPAELRLQVRIHDGQEETSRELVLVRGAQQTLGGKTRGNVHVPGVDEELCRIIRQGNQLLAEGLATRLTLQLDSAPLKAGQKLFMREKGRLVIKHDGVGPQVAEIAYQQVSREGGRPAAPPAAADRRRRPAADEFAPRAPKRF